MNETLDRVNEVFQDVFDNEELIVSGETTAKDIEGWDSLMHVTLIIHIEKAFLVRFTSSEIAGLKNVADLIRLIERHRPSEKALL